MAIGFGFGHYKFGNFPFGKSDFGEDSVIRSFPATYIEDPSTGETNQVLKNYLSIAKYQANSAKTAIDKMSEQVDVNKVKSEILKYIGSTIAVDLDDYEPEDFRKSLVSNAILFYRIKGTKESYKIRGSISGYDVEVVNIWKIDKNIPIHSTVNFFMAEGTGAASQELSGTMFTFPVLKNTLKFKVDGVLVAEDNGSGVISNVIGSAYSVTGTIDYPSGDYLANFIPAPGIGSQITADCDTGLEDFALATSPGGSSLVISSPQTPPYPVYPTSVKIFDNGVQIAEDDGLGGMQPSSGSPFSVSGTVNYDLGGFDFTISPAPDPGHIVTVNFDKTLLGEFMFCKPDDVYEIPSGSGYWYVTLDPSLVAGNLSEGCTYCLTSYIKLKLTVVKPITISTGTENFFDRLVRKLRDITPIHIRDLLYELQMVIAIDENQYLQFGGLQQTEESWLVSSNFHRFDIMPADVVSCDEHGTVTGTIELI